MENEGSDCARRRHRGMNQMNETLAMIEQCFNLTLLGSCRTLCGQKAKAEVKAEMKAVVKMQAMHFENKTMRGSMLSIVNRGSKMWPISSEVNHR